MEGEKKYILNSFVVEKKFRRMALEIIEKNIDENEIILAGIRESGLVVAKNIQKHLSEISPVKTELIALSINKKAPKEVTLNKPVDLNGKVIIVIDDVANSGKTLLYALKPFLDFYPKKIQTLVLVERSHNNFPVRPDYVGLSITTTMQEHIYVEVQDDTVTGAFLK
ncbi:MAG: phosphoribosyltransferase [Bacteroidia bacterium]|nr:phosphoribosyltransferase [Bacteroidia bacterium]